MSYGTDANSRFRASSSCGAFDYISPSVLRWYRPALSRGRQDGGPQSALGASRVVAAAGTGRSGRSSDPGARWGVPAAGETWRTPRWGSRLWDSLAGGIEGLPSDRSRQLFPINSGHSASGDLFTKESARGAWVPCWATPFLGFWENQPVRDPVLGDPHKQS